MTRFLALCLAAASGVLSARAESCANLAAMTMPGTVVTSATAVAAGPFSANTSSPREFPAFCRVLALAKPVMDSEIHIEVWLPTAQAWNGKFLGTGNGGYSGDLGYAEMERALKLGYAVAGSDTGHSGGDLKFAIGHPEKMEDWGWRAVHVMTQSAKLIVRSYYARFARQSYFTGCSTGGHQALMEAQRFPEDYDGIVAGDPGNNRVRLNVDFFSAWLATNVTAQPPLPASKLSMINKAAVAACDAADGIKDGLISSPLTCRFDPATLRCPGADGPECLTDSQVKAVRSVYAGPANPRNGERLVPGWLPGSETGWSGYFVGQREPARLDFWRYWVFNDPNWEFRTFDFDADTAYADGRMAFLTAVNPDLAAFQARNGKLLLYHGWADPVSPPEDTVGYLERVQRTSGGEARASTFVRLFMAPGMGHCGGGPGPNSFDALAALDGWVTSNRPPDKMIASHSTNGVVDRTRPLCPYPQVAVWDGKGNTDDAASFACAAGAPRGNP
jgi:feruloyl esterase